MIDVPDTKIVEICGPCRILKVTPRVGGFYFLFECTFCHEESRHTYRIDAQDAFDAHRH